MNTYRVQVKRFTHNRQLPNRTVTVTAGNERVARGKATRHVHWDDNRKGVRCRYEIESIKRVQDVEKVSPQRSLLERAVEVVGVRPEPDRRGYSLWMNRCHEISLALVKSGMFGQQARVARGWCEGVRSQHSWIAVDGDCYDTHAKIVDPTLFTQRSDVDEVLWSGSLNSGWHKPHGAGSIWQYGKPYHRGGDTVKLDREGLSDAACSFLDALEPLDRDGWAQLAHAPVGDWPAGEIFDRMCDTGLGAFIPIDVVGMITNRNPSGAYR
jgi:hypothetical protein